jgi:heme-degrading monooxygenase HmoA
MKVSPLAEIATFLMNRPCSVERRSRDGLMSEIYATGTWRPKRGQEAAFIEAWLEFATWASEDPAVGTLRLGRDADDPRRFISFARWTSLEAFRAWRVSADAQERIRRVQNHVEEFAPVELKIVATVEDAS